MIWTEKLAITGAILGLCSTVWILLCDDPGDLGIHLFRISAVCIAASALAHLWFFL